MISFLPRRSLVILTLITVPAHLIGSASTASPDEDLSKLIKKNVRMLGDSDFSTREQATEELKKFGEAALRLLRQEIADSADLEVKDRLGDVIRTIEAKEFVEVENCATNPDYSEQVEFSRSGRLAILSLGPDLLIWQVEPWKKLRTITCHSKRILSFAVSENDRFVATCSLDETIAWWDLETGKEVFRFRDRGQIDPLFTCDHGRVLVSVTRDHDKYLYRVWDFAKRAEIQTVTRPTGVLVQAAGDPRSARFFFTEWEVGITALCVSDEKVDYRIPSFNPSRIIVSPQGDHVVCNGTGATVLYDAGSGKRIRELGSEGNRLIPLAVSGDGRCAMSDLDTHDIQLLDLKTGSRLLSLRGHSKNITSIGISPTGRYLLSASQDKTVRLWKIGTVDQ
jgi:WD40 repeat protein